MNVLQVCMVGKYKLVLHSSFFFHVNFVIISLLFLSFLRSLSVFLTHNFFMSQSVTIGKCDWFQQQKMVCRSQRVFSFVYLCICVCWIWSFLRLLALGSQNKLVFFCLLWMKLICSSVCLNFTFRFGCSCVWFGVFLLL